ncbi:hypothetical protein [Haloarchaeobius sp. TZWSO28]|uniref:hypothetical protein n=1 Tax=Haloarchaeobius sp. TZWSO28 TaxID=3446119 RepID=UPI003EB6AF8D
MLAAWDRHLPRETPTEQRELVDYAADCGFDTLIVPQVTPTMADHSAERELQILEIIGPYPDEDVADPAALRQELTEMESAVAGAVAKAPDEYQWFAHRWFPFLLPATPMCLASERALESLERQISSALSRADGIALDGIGYRNYYACHCERCRERRDEYVEATGCHRYEAIADVSEAILFEAVDRLHGHAKTESSDAIVANHVWPPFSPNPGYAYRLPLDYCSQTISWFYPPDRPLDRVAFEARRHAKLSGDANTFVPFVGMFDEPFLRRTPDRLASELGIALDHGEGSLVFSSLAVPFNNEELETVLKEALSSVAGTSPR